MRISTSWFGVFGAVAGLAAGGAAYQMVVAPLAPGDGSSQPVSSVTTPLPEGPRVRAVTAPCEKPAKLEHGVCVTHVWRTQVVYDPPTTTVLPSTTTPGGTVPTGGVGPAGDADDQYDDDDEYDDEDDDHEDDDDDDGDDDHEDDGDDDGDDDHEDEEDD